MERLFARLPVYWKTTKPDLRFGQLVSNAIRFLPGAEIVSADAIDAFPNSLLTITDEEYICLVDEHLDAERRLRTF